MNHVAKNETTTARRARSPSFPTISLSKALDRVRDLDLARRQSETSLPLAAKALGMGSKSSSFLQAIASLKAYGLIDDHGRKSDRMVQVTDLARRILHDARPGQKTMALIEAAWRPKLLGEYVKIWSNNRPPDAYCISELTLERGFNEDSAKTFIRIYDANLRYAHTVESDKSSNSDSSPELDNEGENLSSADEDGFGSEVKCDLMNATYPEDASKLSTHCVNNRRLLSEGLLSKEGATFRVIVSGKVGVKEIDLLIRKLQIDKELLADD